MRYKALLAEFIGTFALVFIGGGAIASDMMTGGSLGITGVAFAHGLTIAVMVGVTAGISGAHFNPAVTCAFLVIGNIDIPNAIGYIVTQCLAALSAAAMLMLCMPKESLLAVGYGTPVPGPDIPISMVFITEIILTFILMFVIYGTAVDKRGHFMGGLYIGFAVILDIYMGGFISGACMNPARHFGPAILSGWTSIMWLYWLAPIIGAVAAVLLQHKVLVESE